MAVIDLPVRPMPIAGGAVFGGPAGTIDLIDPSTGRALGILGPVLGLMVCVPAKPPVS